MRGGVVCVCTVSSQFIGWKEGRCVLTTEYCNKQMLE